SGQCVIVDPRTGETLAMAIVPQFNPNIFRKHRPEQWRNRTITYCFEPGSTMKPFLLAAALDRGIVSPQTRFDCEQGAMTVSNKIIHDTKKHGLLSVSEIVMKSSNIGAVKIGQKLGYKIFVHYLKAFGFGEKTGIDLIGERKGFIREPKSARIIDKATIYFGQGMSASSIQLAMGMAAIANGGKLMRPYVVRAIRDQKGRTVKKTHPKMVRRVLRSEIAKKVSTILEGVVSERGTAPLAEINGYRAAGKTGTSQKVDPRTRRYSKKNYVAMFLGFVPVHNPKLVILVVVDEPRGKRYGGLVAGPVFSEVGSWALNHLRINPQIKMAKFEQKVSERIRVSVSGTIAGAEGKAASAKRLPDFRGRTMREVLKEGTALGLKVLLEGTGFAIGQVPGPGAVLDQITTVKVKFKPPM
ncbi:MAG: transpeptidase family protein, partial [Deltaproteobacteria bacterium]|nr:transpeptidase family protein [Deltaproteobacteria bacterium]